MFGIGMPELVIILVIILIIFGAGKLPEIGGAIGKGIRNFKKSFKENDEVDAAEDPKKIKEEEK
jgi:sec-independent protein translocase protein TatA